MNRLQSEKMLPIVKYVLESFLFLCKIFSIIGFCKIVKYLQETYVAINTQSSAGYNENGTERILESFSKDHGNLNKEPENEPKGRVVPSNSSCNFSSLNSADTLPHPSNSCQPVQSTINSSKMAIAYDNNKASSSSQVFFFSDLYSTPNEICYQYI